MAQDTETFNNELYDLLKVRGYKPVPLNSQNQRVGASQQADVIEFTFTKDGEDFGKAWISVDDASNLKVYFDNEQQDSPDTKTPGVDYDDTWTGLLKNLKSWAQRRQLSFDLKNKDRLGDDMRQRDYYKMKEKLGESYHPMGKKASYNDAVPNVKIVLQHNRALEEGEQRYRNVARIFLENEEGERFLAPTVRPGIARVYARHIAEGGVPNDERWNHIKTVVEDYNKMAGFVRATRNGQFNESALELVNEGVNHYNNLRETLKKMSGHRGYHAYFESWTPALMEGEGEDLSEMFMSMSLDPRIESAMPILSRLKKPVTEMEEVDTLAEWADDIINEKLELDELSPAKKWDYTDKGRKSLDALVNKVADADDSESAKKYADKAVKRQYTIDKTEKSLAHGTMHEKMDSTTKTLAVPADKMLEAPGAETLAHNQSTEKSNLKAFDLAEQDKDDQPIGKGKNAYIVTAPDGKKVTVLADFDWQAKDTAKKHWQLATDAGIRVTPKTAPGAAKPATADTSTSSNAGAAYSQAKQKATDDDTAKQAEPTTTWQRVKQAVQQNWNVPGGTDSTAGLAKALGGVFGVAEGDVVPFKKKKQDDDDDDDSWLDDDWDDSIPSDEDFAAEEGVRAFWKKLSLDDNPYAKGSSVHQYWEIGWTHGYNNSQKGKKNKAPANDLTEMDKSPEANPYHGWGHSKHEVSNGPDKTAKMMRAKDAVKAARKTLDKAFRGDIEEELTPVPSGHKGLNKQQKAAGQVGPTEKAKNISPILGKPQKEHPFNGKLVGAESKEIDPELARIMEIAGIKKI